MCRKSKFLSHRVNVTHHVFLHKFLVVFVEVDAQGLEDAQVCIVSSWGKKKEFIMRIFSFLGSSLKKELW